MKAMILAAGFGTRLKSISQHLPKPALPFFNIPLGYYALELIKTLPVDNVVVNTHHLPEKTKLVFAKQGTKNLSFNFSHEPNEILGNGGGIGFAKDLLKDDQSFVVANGDEVFLPDDPNVLNNLLETHNKSKNLATLLVMEHELVGEKFGGVWTNNKDQIIGFGKTKPENIHKGYHYTGFQILSQEIFDHIPEGPSNILHDVLKKRIGKDRIGFHVCTGKWFETGNEKDYLSATEQFLMNFESFSKHPLLQNLIAENWPAFSIRKDPNLLLGNNVNLSPDAQIDGFCVIGDNSEIGSKCRIKNSVIGSNITLNNCTVKSQLLVDQSQLIYQEPAPE